MEHEVPISAMRQPLLGTPTEAVWYIERPRSSITILDR
ncbi:hypothetical protein Htur_0095 [Haloterrigena turkmenica DSM 5511]|uniref:Uncharacterized protein n=1 Tax=Haloterrigena turkmenica (strain ATCC 51198 / DSM 5511 / JCM 9101 / NCIMB 13204 / VKM B-1734 / 4k) TaxID=543526 RepID=D2RTF3_HALTV|nr:hypothetical protein Htur_0095 [Haloterrigena turkmenica DSM 5511]